MHYVCELDNFSCQCGGDSINRTMNYFVNLTVEGTSDVSLNLLTKTEENDDETQIF